ncbi:MAG: hypothetical protein ACE5GH_00195 [Fidelibacterota bacterium]
MEFVDEAEIVEKLTTKSNDGTYVRQLTEEIRNLGGVLDRKDFGGFVLYITGMTGNTFDVTAEKK